MAVYTHVSAEALADFLKRFDLGALVSAKGIAEGVENSNYMVDTTEGRFFLTLYEKRVQENDLPYFFSMLDHLAVRGCHVPRALPDRMGRTIHELAGRPAALIEFLPGVSVSHPNPAQARAVGAALGRMHLALADFTLERRNTQGPEEWPALLDRCGHQLDTIQPTLYATVAQALDTVLERWPADLPRATIHADLFPDNVLMLGDKVSGLIDFYFACTEIRPWDLAVTHSAWAFDANGAPCDPAIGQALVDGYDGIFPLSESERMALPVLAQGACIRFLLTRAWDWLNTPADALVTRKDPLAYLRRLEFYQAQGTAAFQ